MTKKALAPYTITATMAGPAEYAVPAGKVWIVTLCQISWIDPLNSVTVTAQRVHSATAATSILGGEEVELSSTRPAYSPIIGLLYMNAGDSLQFSASAAGDAQVELCVIEEDA